MKSHCIHGPFPPALHQRCPLRRVRVLTVKQMKSSPAEVSKEPTQHSVHRVGDGCRRALSSSPA